MSDDKHTVLDIVLEKSLQRAISLGEMLTDEQKQRILEARARALAQPISDIDVRSRDTLRVMSFHIGAETYAFPAASVTSVSKSIAITPVPCVPSFVAGITNQRGHIRSVVKLAQYLGLQPGEKDEYVVFAQHQDVEVAFIVSSLDEVTDIPVSEIKARPVNMSTRSNQFIAGVVPGGLILLDLQAIFSDDDFLVNDEIFA